MRWTVAKRKLEQPVAMISSPSLTVLVNCWAASDTISASHINCAFGAGKSPIRSRNFQLRYRLLSLGADMRRREFLGVLGAAACPLGALAEQATPVVGFLASQTPDL